MPGILIVEDDRVLQRALRRLLEAEGYSVEISSDGRSALEAVRKSSLTAIILDLRLPLISGIDVCREIRHGAPSLPIIVLSASTDIADKVLLFELGADDYVTKPFSPRELLARVRVAIRRRAMPSSGDEMKFDGVLVDFVRMRAMREGQPVALTTSQFKILKFFLHHADEVISRETLLKEILGYEEQTCTRTVDNHILRLRQKLEKDPANPTHFCTVRGVGYKFVS